ncbi:hypothetical protein EJB05_01271 [Eragrostis curvula]|uniref:Uncharacterized protein n=1 Tax=Eragrostis curvula TaxID=38414 RepID=A0A5J9WPT9_9POAL|nr:hypothetical protein EJB05_01271 [Eragrostis curvula]
MTDYERVRAQTIMRNNQMLQSLGVGALASLFNNSSKTKNTAHQTQQGKDKECLVDQDAADNSPMDSLTMNTLQSGGIRSKRVMAVEEGEDQPAARVTRQRTKELRSEETPQATSTSAQEDLLAVADWSSQPEDHIQLCNEGNLLMLSLERCKANKANREKVQYQQRTGSRSFVAYGHVLAQMEAILAEPVVEGQVPKTPAEAIAQVLPSTKFLQKIGQDSASTKRSAKSAARVRELEAEVEATKQGAAALKDKVEELEKKVADSEEGRENQLGEIEELRNLTGELKKRQEKMETVLQFFAGINRE